MTLQTNLVSEIQPNPERARALAAVYRLLAELGRRARQQQVERVEVDGRHGGVAVGEREKGERDRGATVKKSTAGAGPAAGDGRRGPGSLHLPPESISGDGAEVKSRTGAVAK